MRRVRHKSVHRARAAVRLGRDLRPGEVVHHKDGNRYNNHPDNLEVMTDAEHHRLHGLWTRRRNHYLDARCGFMIEKTIGEQGVADIFWAKLAELDLSELTLR